MSETKYCAGCDTTKLIAGFSRNASARDGLQSRCKVCQAIAAAAYYQAHKEQCGAQSRRYHRHNKDSINERHRERREAHPEVAREQERRYRAQPGYQAIRANYRLFADYGITLADYDAMLAAQGGGCAICGKPPEENGQRLCVDHCHATGRIRGLLCSNCNKALGLLQDNPEFVRRAMIYLQES